jgi:DNA polymerase III alpha subunit (gram-positive type)
MLSHSKNLFESGMEKYRQNGFWRMKQTTDPWTIRKDKKPVSNKPAKRVGDGDEGVSKKRRISTDEGDTDDSDHADSADERRSLVDEVRMLKEEIKKKDQEVADNKYSYLKLLEQFRQLQQQMELFITSSRKQQFQQQQHLQQQQQQQQQQLQQQQLHQQQQLQQHIQQQIQQQQQQQIQQQQQQQQHLQQQPMSPPMNPKQWDALHPQPWLEPVRTPPQQQHDMARKMLVMSASVPQPTPKWTDDSATLRFSTPQLHPLHFNFPLSAGQTSPSSSKSDDAFPPQLRLSPLATL